MKKNIHPHLKEGLKLKIRIIKAQMGYADLHTLTKKLDDDKTGVSEYMIKDYTCGKKKPTERAKELLDKALKEKEREIRQQEGRSRRV